MDLGDPMNMLSSILIGCIGFGYFKYGKSQGRMYPLIAGMAMFVYPYFVPAIWLMWTICAGLMAACWFLREQ
jgi:hypothetical protein